MSAPTNRWIITIAKLFGIPVRIHGSFFIFLIWILYQSGGGWLQLSMTAFFFFSIFFCVLLHELGHTTVARFYEIKTRDITLYPFGGIALLLSQPKAKQELVIALAGPLVNIVIAGLLFSLRQIFTGQMISNSLPPISAYRGTLVLDQLIQTNILLAVFNLIPAIPMDGGRVLRSVLEIMKVESATIISGRISQICAVAMGIVRHLLGLPDFNHHQRVRVYGRNGRDGCIPHLGSRQWSSRSRRDGRTGQALRVHAWDHSFQRIVDRDEGASRCFSYRLSGAPHRFD